MAPPEPLAANDSRWLLRWTDLGDARAHPVRRRRAMRVVQMVAAVGACAFASVRELDAAAWWLAGACAWVGVSLILSTHRFFWRTDTALLARLPIGGRALLGAAVARAQRDAAWVGATVLTAAAPLIVAGKPMAPIVTVFALACGGIGGLVPAAATGAAMLVARGSGRVLADHGGPELPATGWLGLLPGLAAAAVVLAILTQHAPLGGEVGLFGGGWELAAVGALTLALPLAATAGAANLPAALHEVAALDRQQLAHVETHDVRWFESWVARRLPPGAALLYRKDARLMRRRYPLIGLAGVTLWLGAFAIATLDAGAQQWALAHAVWTLLLGRGLAERLTKPPVELPRLTPTLFERGAVHLAKRAWLAVWITVFVAPSAAMFVATGEPALAATGVLTLLLSAVLSWSRISSIR